MYGHQCSEDCGCGEGELVPFRGKYGTIVRDMLYELIQQFLSGLELMGITDEIDALPLGTQYEIEQIQFFLENTTGTIILPYNHVDDGPCECEECFIME